MSRTLSGGLSGQNCFHNNVETFRLFHLHVYLNIIFDGVVCHCTVMCNDTIALMANEINVYLYSYVLKISQV